MIYALGISAIMVGMLALAVLGGPVALAIAETAPLGCEDYRGAERSACVVELAR